MESGHTPSRKVPKYWGGEIPWVSVSDARIHDGGIINDTVERITQAGLSNSSARLLPEGTICLSRTASIGYVVKAGCNLATSQGFVNWICSAKLDPDFLAYLLKFEAQFIDDLATGSTHKTLYYPEVKAFHVCIPEVEEQRRIVAVLNKAFAALDRARALAEANLADAEELFPAILGRAFEPSAPWPMKTVSDLIHEQILDRPIDGNHGETHPKKADFVGKGVPFIMASDIMDGVVNQDECYFIRREQADALRKGFAKDGDILLSHKGTIGRAAILKTSLDYVMLTPQVTYYRVIDEKRLDREFLYYCFQSSAFLKKMKDIAGIGATRAYIGITRQHELEIPLPSLEVQHTMVARFKSVRDKVASAIELYGAQVSDSIQLRQSLLSKAFAGELT